MQIGKLINLLRTAEGLSQTELAEKLGITRAYLSQIENGHNDPGMSLMRKLSEYFDVPIGILLGGGEGGTPEIAIAMRDLLAEVLATKIMFSGSNKKKAASKKKKRSKKPA